MPSRSNPTSSNPAPEALTPRQWCAANGISLSHFWKLRREGLAPDCIQIGTGSTRGRLLITSEATMRWREAMTARNGLERPKSRWIIELWQRVEDGRLAFVREFDTEADARAWRAINCPNAELIKRHVGREGR